MYEVGTRVKILVKDYWNRETQEREEEFAPGFIAGYVYWPLAGQQIPYYHIVSDDGTIQQEAMDVRLA